MFFYGKDFFTNVMQISKYSINSLESPKQFVPPSHAGLNQHNINSWIAQFPTVNGKGTGLYKGEPVSITVIPGSPPKYHGARQVAFALTTRAKKPLILMFSVTSGFPSNILSGLLALFL